MSDQLWERIRIARRQAQLTQQKLADYCGVSKSAVAQWEAKGTQGTRPELQRIQLIAEATGVSVAWILTGNREIGEPELGLPVDSSVESHEASAMSSPMLLSSNPCICSTGYAFLPNYEAIVYCNEPDQPRPVEVCGVLAFKAGWLSEIGARKDQIAVIHNAGHSMWPTICDGEAVLIHRGDVVPRTGEIYALQRRGHYEIRRLIDHWSSWLVSADNPDKGRYPDFQLPADQLHSVDILGRIIWRGGRI